MTRLIIALIVGGVMVMTVGAYAATLAGTNSAEVLGSTGDITVNAPGVGDVVVTWTLLRTSSNVNFGLVTGATVDIETAPGEGNTYEVLLRIEDGNGDLLGGGIESITDTGTSVNISFGDELDPEDITNAIIVITGTGESSSGSGGSGNGTTTTVLLLVVDGYDEKDEKTLSEMGKTYMVQTSDNEWWDTLSGFYTSYQLSNQTIPSGATITSVKIHLEHWEESDFTGAVEWNVGTGWPDNPTVWGTINSTLRIGESNEADDVWDVTNVVNTPARVQDMEFQVQNDSTSGKITKPDYIYVELKWYEE